MARPASRAGHRQAGHPARGRFVGRQTTGQVREHVQGFLRMAAVAAHGSDRPPAMMAWLDARASGFAAQFDLPNVAQACAETDVIPPSLLADAGAYPRLLARQ